MTAPITSTDYAGQLRTLTHHGRPVTAGETLEDFRGHPAVITGATAPHKPSSTGRIHTTAGSYYPSVFGCSWTPSN